jgi:WhiB family transcriptional regulator, redox-sensing transcriptional regulator
MSVNPVTVADLLGMTRISHAVVGSSLRGADMTLINVSNLHTAVPSWELDTFSLATITDASLATVPGPTLDDLAEFEMFDDEPRGTSYARCSDGNGTLSYLFFSDDDFDIARAKAICSKCGLREACLAGALERGEVAGVWGGELVEEGEVVVLKRRRGRPPKVARPVLVVDEVPIPPHLVA